MRYFQDTGLLILYSFPTLFFIDPDSHFIIALLCSLILICCCYVFESRIFLSILFLIYGLLTLLMPRLLLFCPVLFTCHFISSICGCFSYGLPGIYFYLLYPLYPFLPVYGHFRISVCMPDFSEFCWLFFCKEIQKNMKNWHLISCHSRDDSEELNLLHLAEKNTLIWKNRTMKSIMQH